METNNNKFFCFVFLATGLAYGARQLGNLGQLALPSGSALASYSATMTEIANRTLPISSTVLGSAALTVHFQGLSCKEKCKANLILGIWGLSVGLAPLLPVQIGPWVERAGRGFLAICSPINQYFYHKERDFKHPAGWLGSIAELAKAGLFSPLPSSQWIEPIAGLSGMVAFIFFKKSSKAVPQSE